MKKARNSWISVWIPLRLNQFKEAVNPGFPSQVFNTQDVVKVCNECPARKDQSFPVHCKPQSLKSNFFGTLPIGSNRSWNDMQQRVTINWGQGKTNRTLNNEMLNNFFCIFQFRMRKARVRPFLYKQD